MKFEREKDIPELRGKTRKERQGLREQARIQDPIIPKMELLGIVVTLLFIPVADWIADWTRSYSLLAWLGVFAVFTAPFALGFRGFFIVPRIRRALASYAHTKI